jgi:ankyrin repeat protein
MGADGHRTITDAAWNSEAKAVALMLELGFDPRTPGPDTGSALHCACWQGSAETVRVLLRHRDARSLLAIKDAQHGGTPLGWCIHGSRFGNASHDHAGAAKLLLEAGAELESGPVEASPSVEAVISDWRRRHS